MEIGVAGTGGCGAALRGAAPPAEDTERGTARRMAGSGTCGTVSRGAAAAADGTGRGTAVRIGVAGIGGCGAVLRRAWRSWGSGTPVAAINTAAAWNGLLAPAYRPKKALTAGATAAARADSCPASWIPASASTANHHFVVVQIASLPGELNNS